MSEALTRTDHVCNLQLGAVETLTVYHALITHLRVLANKPQPPTTTIDQVSALIRVIEPAAIQAADILRGSQPVAPN
jgi:hypothetical protein